MKILSVECKELVESIPSNNPQLKQKFLDEMNFTIKASYKLVPQDDMKKKALQAFQRIVSDRTLFKYEANDYTPITNLYIDYHIFAIPDSTEVVEQMLRRTTVAQSETAPPTDAS